MFVSFWNAATLLLFSVQRSYVVTDVELSSRVLFVNGSLQLCVLKGDFPFKKSSKTYPRTELRLLEEVGDDNKRYTFSVNFTSGDFENLSYWQIFGSSPEVMIRVRNGEKQLVVFGGDPKIQVVDELPRRCSVTCGDARGRGASVECDVGEPVKARIRCKGKLHLKLGPYLQHVDSTEDVCVMYGGVSSGT